MSNILQATDVNSVANRTLPAYIMLEKWADIGFFWQGELLLNELPRLSTSLGCVQSADVLVLTVRLAKEDGVLYLTYQVTGNLPVSCQRCLSPLVYDVSGVYRMALLRDEREVNKIGENDYVFLSELCDNNRLAVKDLLEDELLLTLPLSPRHENCQMLIDSVGEIDEEDVESHPFAVLARLKSTD